MLVSGFVIVLVLIKVGLLLKQETLHFSFSDRKIKYKKLSFFLTNKTSNNMENYIIRFDEYIILLNF